MRRSQRGGRGRGVKEREVDKRERKREGGGGGEKLAKLPICIRGGMYILGEHFSLQYQSS